MERVCGEGVWDMCTGVWGVCIGMWGGCWVCVGRVYALVCGRMCEVCVRCVCVYGVWGGCVRCGENVWGVWGACVGVCTGVWGGCVGEWGGCVGCVHWCVGRCVHWCVGRVCGEGCVITTLSTCIFTHSDEAWEIDKRDLELGRELGSGQFGVSITLGYESFLLPGSGYKCLG